MKIFWQRVQFLFGKTTLIGGFKSLEEIKDWLTTHGIERSTAAQIMGFLGAYGIELPQIPLCNYGLTYSYREFCEWFTSPHDDTMPKENTMCILWNDKYEEAIVTVMTGIERKALTLMPTFTGGNGVKYSNCMRFDNFSQFRYLLNVPNDMQVDLPQMMWAKKMQEEIESMKNQEKKEKTRKKRTKKAESPK